MSLPDCQILQGDCLDVMRTLPDESVHCCVTSPPYWGLRDYGVVGQIGLERTPEEYVAKMVEVFSEVRRVLRADGTLWLNLGDCYATGAGKVGDCPGGGAQGDRWRGSNHTANKGNRGSAGVVGPVQQPNRMPLPGLKPKDLCGIPWRVAFALQQPYAVPTCVKAEIDRAWLAAMFDGEGCIGIRRFDSYREEKQQVYQDGFVVYTVVTNNDIELLDKCISVTGLGKAALKSAAGNSDKRGVVSRRDSYGWRLDGNGAIDVVRAIYPYLVAKRKQACIAYTLDCLNKNGHGSRAVPADVQEKKRFLWGLIKACNQRQSIDLPSWIDEPRQEIQPGWYLRSDIIWHKPNPMPESVTDRPTKSHEYLFLLAKSERYYYDAEAIKEPCSPETNPRYARGRSDTHKWADGGPGDQTIAKSFAHMRKLAPNGSGIKNNASFDAAMAVMPDNRNKRSVWTVPSAPYSEAHFATFPPDLIKPCILAGCSVRCCPKCGAPHTEDTEDTEDYKAFKQSERERKGKGNSNGGAMRASNLAALGLTRGTGNKSVCAQKISKGWNPSCECGCANTVAGVVLDPFGGSGTTGMVALELGRKAILIELNPDYVELAETRCNITPGLCF